jgi:hypothetical protein
MAESQLNHGFRGVAHVLTPRRYSSAIVRATFTKGLDMVTPRLGPTLEPGDVGDRPGLDGQERVVLGRPINMTTYGVVTTINQPPRF